MRRHQENQAAMGRYWMRTEEEEAQWRADAEKRAAEEAERYRNEPASPPQRDGKDAEGGGERTVVEKVAGSEKVTCLDGKQQALDKVEEVVEDSSDSDTDEEAGAKCNQEAEEVAMAEENTGGVQKDSEKSGAEPRSKDVSSGQTKADEREPAPTTTQPPTTEDPKLAESRSFFESLAEKQAAEERAKRGSSPAPTTSTLPTSKPEITETSTHKSSSTGKSARSSSGSLSKNKPATSRSSTSSTSSAESLSKSNFKEKEKEKDKGREKSRSVSTTKSSSNLKSGTAGTPAAGGNMTDKPLAGTSNSRAGSSHNNHLHLRRGRRYFDSHKHEVMA